MHRLMLLLVSPFLFLSVLNPIVGAETKKPEFTPHAEVLKGYEKVISTADGKKSLWTIYTRKKDGQMYAELPSGFATQKYFFAMTVSSGDVYAGLQAGDMYVYWRRFDKQLALMAPYMDIRSSGDTESKASVKRLFTDRVITTIPIKTMGPGGGPVIDLDQLFVGQSSIFFPPSFMSFFSRYSRPLIRSSSLITIKKAKAYPTNVELAFEIPRTGGRLQTLHYSISKIKGTAGFKSRKADERIGYFTTSYSDYGKYKDDESRVRYINRWSLQKADSKLKLSPPKKPIVFYIEHTTPVRYRRWVRKGALAWNKAFEKIGFSNAIEVHYQDSASKAHMEKDPEDIRYNFIRWLTNNKGTAIGPSRVNPLTGEILDADIILTDGWIRHYQKEFNKIMPKIAMSGFTAETLAWFNSHPDWDPRIRMAHPSERDYLIAQRIKAGVKQFGGHQMTQVESGMMGSNIYDGLIGRTSQVNGFCLAADGKSLDVALMNMLMNVPLAFYEDEEGDKKDETKDDKKDDEKDKDKDDKKKDKKNEETKLDGLPESFIGPLIADLVSHEVGHTLGLRHNFKASSLYNLSEINDEKTKGKKPFAGSVMDYIGVNINVKTGKIQGDYSMIGIGPYDEWAIEYGYTTEKDLKPILSRVAEPELQYATDEDVYGPDPHVQLFDLGKNPLEFSENQIRLVKYHRKNLISQFVKDGESWAKAREGYHLTLIFQMKAVFNMTRWIGSAFVNRDHKGDKNGRTPVSVVPVEQQRAALKFVIENTFRDEAFGLTPDIVNHMTVEKWLDGVNYYSLLREEPTWPVHDRIMAIQAATLSRILNPTTLRRIFDNELRVPSDKDALTLPELLKTITTEIWKELDTPPGKKYTVRIPMISSLRRNLQREHLKRMIDLMLPGNGINESIKPVSNLATLQLRNIQAKIEKILKSSKDKLDDYTLAHLTEAGEIIRKSLNSEYIYNANKMGGRMPSFFFGKETGRQEN